MLRRACAERQTLVTAQTVSSGPFGSTSTWWGTNGEELDPLVKSWGRLKNEQAIGGMRAVQRA